LTSQCPFDKRSQIFSTSRQPHPPNIGPPTKTGAEKIADPRLFVINIVLFKKEPKTLALRGLIQTTEIIEILQRHPQSGQRFCFFSGKEKNRQ
jgi:hypothetical protein